MSKNDPFAKVKELYSRLPDRLKNKYALTAIAFFIWLAFFDRNHLIHQWKQRAQLRDLERQEIYYKDQIQALQETKAELFGNDGSIERFAREEYYMKRDNEDLYVIVMED